MWVRAPGEKACCTFKKRQRCMHTLILARSLASPHTEAALSGGQLDKEATGGSWWKFSSFQAQSKLCTALRELLRSASVPASCPGQSCRDVTGSRDTCAALTEHHHVLPSLSPSYCQGQQRSTLTTSRSSSGLTHEAQPRPPHLPASFCACAGSPTAMRSWPALHTPPAPFPR